MGKKSGGNYQISIKANVLDTFKKRCYCIGLTLEFEIYHISVEWGMMGVQRDKDVGYRKPCANISGTYARREQWKFLPVESERKGRKESNRSENKRIVSVVP